MQYIQEITLDIHQHGYVSINAKQGDQNGRFIRIHLTNNGEEIKLENGESVEFRALKPDGNSVDNPATIEEGGTILACLTDQALAVDGEVVADIAIKHGSDVVSTLNFVIDVQKAPLGEDIPSTNEFGTLTKATEDAVSATNRANDAAGLIEGMTVSASKVAAGGTPTAKLTTDGDHYNLALGLVTGDKGDKGEKGDTPTIEIAETVTGAPGDPAKVENVGTATDPKLKFTIPRGDPGQVQSVNGQTGNVVIGGRNLLPGTAAYYNGSAWKFLDAWTFDGIYNGLRILKKDTYNYGFGYPITLDPGTYTFSCFVKTSECNGVRITADGAGEVLFQQVFPDWERISYTFTLLTREEICCRVQHLGGGDIPGTLFVCGHKLEKGNVSTDWAPAPEDKADVPLQFDVSLPASGWASGQQTVKDARFVDGDYGWDVDVKGACIPWDGVTIAAGQLVAKADITPTTDMTWTVTRREVRRDG